MRASGTDAHEGRNVAISDGARIQYRAAQERFSDTFDGRTRPHIIACGA